jgi:predicted transcriptional regulator
MRREGFDQMPVLNEKGAILGMVTEANVLSQLMRKRVKKEDAVDKVCIRMLSLLAIGVPCAHSSEPTHRKCVAGGNV